MTVRICEMGARDGLQNEKNIVPVEAKIAFIDALSQSGVDEVEVSSFVSPKWIPQLADATEVFNGIQRRDSVVYSALVPNKKGLDRALALPTPPDKVAIFAAASETFSQKNTNASIDACFERFEAVAQTVKQHSALKLRGYISCGWHCPYEGPTDPKRVLEVARRLIDLGCDEISLGDTVGRATAHEVEERLSVVLPEIDAAVWVMHFHDTFGRAADNVRKSYQLGIRAFDAAVGGLGGCPYAGPGAPGNVATETVVRTLLAEGAHIEVSLDALAEAKALIAPYFKP